MNKNMFIKKGKYFIPAIIWMIVIFSFSCQVGSESDKNNHFVVTILNELKLEVVNHMDYNLLNFLIRKAAHITEYFILFMLLYFALKKTFYKSPKLKASIITVLYACTDEFHQLFTTGREGRVRDVFIDSIGIIIGLFIIYIFHTIKKHRKKQ
ncbi:VanZ family protein [Clostridium sp. Marseille-Q2269]|uniref:VanZ family protein n=1 Tax=Clostridium sp. Marseille-Q2269 TaxID=2942205 RepID=UPI002073A813|nr:VanZ family protein [Clostridium sp. Marseille-Q2269]